MSQLSTVEALSEALDDEYRARATYRKVIERFGAVRPFVNIAEAEDRHVSALLAQFRRLGAPAPPDTWPDRVEAPDTLAGACAAAVQAEIDNVALYDRATEHVADEQARMVMRRLQSASRTRHLPAFRRCLQRHEVSAASDRARANPSSSRYREFIWC